MTDFQINECYVQGLARMAKMLLTDREADRLYYDEMNALRDMNRC